MTIIMWLSHDYYHETITWAAYAGDAAGLDGPGVLGVGVTGVVGGSGRSEEGGGVRAVQEVVVSGDSGSILPLV